MLRLPMPDMQVLASPIHYNGLSSQLQSCLAGFHAITKLSKATKYVLILNSVDEDVAQAATLSFKQNVRYFEGEVSGIFCFHDVNRNDKAYLYKLEKFGTLL